MPVNVYRPSRAEVEAVVREQRNATRLGSHSVRPTFPKNWSLRGVDLSDADLSSGDFRHEDLVGAKLRGANLFCASFDNCRLENADITDANLHGARFPDACLMNARIAEGSIIAYRHGRDGYDRWLAVRVDTGSVILLFAGHRATLEEWAAEGGVAYRDAHGYNHDDWKLGTTVAMAAARSLVEARDMRAWSRSEDRYQTDPIGYATDELSLAVKQPALNLSHAVRLARQRIEDYSLDADRRALAESEVRRLRGELKSLQARLDELNIAQDMSRMAEINARLRQDLVEMSAEATHQRDQRRALRQEVTAAARRNGWHPKWDFSQEGGLPPQWIAEDEDALRAARWVDNVCAGEDARAKDYMEQINELQARLEAAGIKE